MAVLRGNFNFRPTILPLAGSPKEEFSQLLDSRISAFDEGVASENLTTNMLSTMGVATGEEGVRNDIALDAEQRLQALADEFEGAYEDPKFRMRQASLTRELVKNKDLNILAQNKVNFDLYNKLKIEDPSRLDFNTWRDHLENDKEGGLSTFTPQLENRENYTAAADNAIKPHITYINENNKSGLTILAPGQGINTTDSYMIIKKDETVFNIHDNSPEAKEMRQLLMDHALPIFEKSKAGDQLGRALGSGLIQDRNLEDITGDQSKISEELLNTLLDRFPGVRTSKTSISTVRPHITRAGGSGKDGEVNKRFSFNDPTIVQPKVDIEDAYDALVSAANERRDTTMAPEDLTSLSNFYEDPNSGNIAFKGQPPSAAARAALTTTLSKAVGRINSENALTAIVENAADYVTATSDIENALSLWADPTDFNSLNKPALAIQWFGQEAFDLAGEAAVEEEGIFDVSYWKDLGTDAFNALTGSVIETYTEFGASTPEEEESARALKQERADSKTQEHKERYENRAAERLLENDDRWLTMIEQRDATALIAIEQNTTSFPRVNFDLAGASASKINDSDFKLNQHIINNSDKVDFYNEAGVKIGNDIASDLEDGIATIKIVDWLAGGARGLNREGKAIGLVDPDLMEIGARLYDVNKSTGKIVGNGEVIQIRGFNIDKQIREHLSTPAEINSQALRASMANIVESGLIPENGFYRLTPNEINTALRTFTNADYLQVYQNLNAQGLTSLSALNGTSSGGDAFNIVLKRQRNPEAAGGDMYSFHFLRNGEYQPLRKLVPNNGRFDLYQAVDESNAPDALAVILNDYFYDLLSNYTKPAEQ